MRWTKTAAVIFDRLPVRAHPVLPVPPSPPDMPPVPPAPGPDLLPIPPEPGEKPQPSHDPEEVEGWGASGPRSGLAKVMCR